MARFLPHFLEFWGELGAPTTKQSKTLKRTHTQKTKLALTGGDDYELLFTLAPEQLKTAQSLATDTHTRITVIGQIEKSTDHRHELTLTSGSPTIHKGFNHFTGHDNTP